MGAGQELTPDTVLADMGLDSLAAVALIFDLEDELGVTLPDSAFSAGTFDTVATLWAAVDGESDRQPSAS
ncbi:acyl carrier protein [Micromonospora sp. ZYX-F-536]|uniref:acyl carrier protein n=1 Tax=Micromonospora sp. ZYX-F-536 TaxID=3457629 RepID=UPI004040702C